MISWNEMKVVRSLGSARHTSVIQFQSFIITPSYAMITMYVNFFLFAHGPE